MVFDVPESVKIFHLTYTIEQVPEHLCVGCWGWADKENQRIFIQENMTLDRKREILHHEISHAIWSTAGRPDQEEEETFIKTISVGWTMIMRDSPRLMEFLLQGTITPKDHS